MPDVRGGAYSRQQINVFRTSDWQEQIIWDSLSSSDGYNYVVYDVFLNETKRESPDPYPNQLSVRNSTVVDGGAVSTTYGFTSKTYTDVQPTDIENILCDLRYDNSEGGDVKFEVSVDGGSNYTTIVDTSLVIDNRAIGIDISAVKGNDIIVRVEITTDGSGNGAEISYFSVIF